MNPISHGQIVDGNTLENIGGQERIVLADDLKTNDIMRTERGTSATIHGIPLKNENEVTRYPSYARPDL